MGDISSKSYASFHPLNMHQVKSHSKSLNKSGDVSSKSPSKSGDISLEFHDPFQNFNYSSTQTLNIIFNCLNFPKQFSYKP